MFFHAFFEFFLKTFEVFQNSVFSVPLSPLPIFMLLILLLSNYSFIFYMKCFKIVRKREREKQKQNIDYIHS